MSSEPLPKNRPRSARRAPLAAVAASFALGILWAQSTRAVVPVPWLLAGAGCCLLVGLLLLRASWERIAVGFALAALVPTGVAAMRLYPQRFSRNHVCHLESLGVDVSEPVRLEGKVISSPYRTGYGMQFDLEVQRIESRDQVHAVTGKVRLRLQGFEEFDSSTSAGLAYGDTIRTLVRLRRPHVYRNPGSFDFRGWMEDIEDIYWVGTIKNSRLIENLGHARSFSVSESIERVRQRLLRGIEDVYPPWSAEGRYGAVLKAVLWGDRTSLDSDTIEGFRKTGLYHLLVIAGLHVGLLTLLLSALLRRFPWSPTVKSAITVGFLVTYASLVEQRAPTLRATLMIGFYLVARLLDRDHSALNSIGCVAFILLYHRPVWLFESGFQLSFGAALLIVGVAVPVLESTTEPCRRALLRLDDVLLDDFLPPRVAQVRLDLRGLVQALRRASRLLERHSALARGIVVLPCRLVVWAANMLLFSAVLQLGLLLPMVETFHRVTFAGVGLNALAIPVMTVLLALALPINLLSVASPALAAWPAKLLSLVMAALFDLTHLPSYTAWLSYRVPEPPSWVVWGFCGAFVVAAWTLRYAPRLKAAALAVATVFVVLVAVHPFAPHLPKGTLEMTALDCGQGDSLLLVLPDQTTVLVNAGGGPRRGTHEGGSGTRRWNPGEDIVSPYLWSRGLTRVDVVVLTDASRLDGVGAVLDNFQVGEFWCPDSPETSEFLELREKVEKRGIPLRSLSAGMTVPRGNTQIHVLWPPTQNPWSATAANHGASVLRVSTHEASYLLLGHLNRMATNQLLISGEPLLSTVLEMGDPGSKSSLGPEFAARIAPRVALVDADNRDREALTNPEALNPLLSTKARIVRTDIDGATTVTWAKGALAVQCYGGSTERRGNVRPQAASTD